MASVNPHTRELVFKLVFYGPGLGGKTTTLQYIHAATKAEHRGKMVSLATPTDRTLYFDFLPIRVPRVRGMSVRLQLFTVPGQVYYAATRKLVLSGADGVVFVADSQAGRMEVNQESLDDLHANLAEHNRSLDEVPHTFHWNKRDLSDLVALEDLDRRFNPRGAPSLGTVATKGDGVFEGLERITRLVLKAYEKDPKVRIEATGGIAGPSILGLEGEAPLPEDGIVTALRQMEGASAPEPPTKVSAVVPDTTFAAPLDGELRSNGPPRSVADPIPRSVDGIPRSVADGVARSLSESFERQRSEKPKSEEVLLEFTRSEKPKSEKPLVEKAKSEKPLVEKTNGDKAHSDKPLSERGEARPSPADSGAWTHFTIAEPVGPSPEASREAAAAAESVRTMPSFSLADLWPEAEHERVRQAEAMLAARDAVNAILACDVLVTRVLASAAGLVGTLDAPRDPALVTLLLGLDGGRYLRFRTVVRAARHREAVTMRDALECFTFSIEARRAREALRR